jgi:RNA polymerase primary sigma factor
MGTPVASPHELNFRKVPLLDTEQERQFSRRIRQVRDSEEAEKDATEARNEMSLANVGLVTDIANNYRGMGVPFEDLVSEGYLGLLEACNRYDSERFANKFSTYATWWIKRNIISAVKQQQSVVRVPDYLITLRHKYYKHLSRMTTESDSVLPTFEMVADAMGLGAGTRANLRQSLAPVASISDSEHHLPIEMSMAQVDDQDMLDHRMDAAKLNARQKEVLRMRFGMDMSLKSIGKRFGFTRERARVVQNKALHRLRTA